MKTVKASIINGQKLTNSDLANRTIETWNQAVTEDPLLGPGKKPFKKSSTISPESSDLYDIPLMNIENSVKRAIEILGEQKLIDENSVVLDLGCGKGTFTLPLSKIVKRVDALDISVQMIDYLNNKIESEKITNVRTIQEDWLDFTRKNKDNQYHLVVSSLNSSMYNGRAIMEMTRISKRACLFSSPYQRLNDPVISELDTLIPGIKTKPEIDCRNIIYPFNILYYLGYKPLLEYVDGSWTYREIPDEAVKRLIARYEEFMEVTDEIIRVIKNYVYAHQKGGSFEQITYCHVGLLLWDVNIPYK